MTPASTAPRSSNGQTDRAGRGGFRLIRYFTIATLIAFLTVGAAIWLLQHMEEVFFADVQREQAMFFTQAQAELARQHEEAARADLMHGHEANHVNLTLLMANMLWADDIAPLVAAAQRIDVEPCRALSAADGGAAAARHLCTTELGRRIRALPGFRALDSKAYAAMHGTRVFKVKVLDLRGVVIYSSEHAQVGDDGAPNRGWQLAAGGTAASELTHRDRFSAFERVVENRDLISSYVPVRAAGAGPVLGVFEIYSDVTDLLDRMKSVSQHFADITAANDVRANLTAHTNQALVGASSTRFMLIVGALLALLYAVSWLIVCNGQRLIDRQRLAHERSNARERQSHREKMAALATMSANVAHEVGNPLAIISGVAQELPAGGSPPAHEVILEQSGRIASMMRHIADFASTRGSEAQWVDVNAMVKAVCDFHAFDQRFRGRPIEFVPAGEALAHQLVPDHLNEAVMGLLQGLGNADTPGDGATAAKVRVATGVRDDGAVLVRAEAVGAAVSSPPRLDALRGRLRDMGWAFRVDGPAVEITLPPSPAAD